MADTTEIPRTDALTSIAAVSTVMVAALSFVPAVSGPVWWWTAAVFGTVGVLVAAAGRTLRMPVIASGLLGITVLPLLAVLVAGGGAGLFFVLPTEGAASSVMSVISRATTQIYSDTVPAASTPGLVLLLALGIGAACVAADTIAAGYRAPLVALVVAVALAIVPGRALPIGTNAWLLLALAVGGLLLVVADRRRRGRRIRFFAITGAGAGAVVLALVAQLVLPTPPAADADASPLSLFGSGVDPLIRLGDDLHRGANVVVLSYTTNSTSAQYLRLATLERFTGATWYPNAADDPTQRSGGGSSPIVAPLSTISNAVAQETVSTTVMPATATSVQQRLPIPYLPTTVRTTVDGFAWDDSGYTLARTDTTQSIGDYSVSSLDVEPTAAQLNAITPSQPTGDSESLSLPSTVPASILTTAKLWTKNAATPYDKAVAIQNMLRGPEFTYDENTPVQEGYDGDGLSVIAKFLQVRAGYCVHFASTMAVMARLLGIPSRIVVGYQPTSATKVDGRITATVHSDDLHAWPELYFGSAGWVRFEPTPSRGTVPAYAATSTGASPSATVTATPTVTPTAVAPRPAQSAAVADPRSGTTGIRPRASSSWALGGGISLGVLALLAVPGLARVAVRRRRRRRFRDASGAEAGWRELLDTAIDLRLALPRDGSPRLVGAALRTAVGLDAAARPAVIRLTDAYERRMFGARAAPVDDDDVADVRSALGRAAGGWARALAAVVPSSLLGTIKSVATGVRVVTTGERPTR